MAIKYKTRGKHGNRQHSNHQQRTPKGDPVITVRRGFLADGSTGMIEFRYDDTEHVKIELSPLIFTPAELVWIRARQYNLYDERDGPIQILRFVRLSADSKKIQATQDEKIN